MRLFNYCAIALTPFILNAQEDVGTTKTEKSSVEIPLENDSISIPKSPLIETSFPAQEGVGTTKTEEFSVEIPLENDSTSITKSPLIEASFPAQEGVGTTKTEGSSVEIPLENDSISITKSPLIETSFPAQEGVGTTKTEGSSVEIPLGNDSTSITKSPLIEASLAETPSDNAPEEVLTRQESVCTPPFHVMHVDIRHTESKGIGYQDGYTTLEGFGIYDHNPSFMPFLDLRGHVFNDGKLAGNIGLGERTYISSINHLLGVYCYYDVRQENHHLTVNQIGPGIEFLGKRMEYRINGYFPVGRDESHSYNRKFKKFEGHSIFMKQKRKYAMLGVDAEVGAHITQSTNHDVYAGFGPYYFTADPFSAWGGKARFLWRYKEYVSLEASYSYDHLFKNVIQGTIGFSYPFGKKLQRKGENCDLVLSRGAFAPYRFEIPVVKRKTHSHKAVNPTTGAPWNVWFVDNTSHSAGTFESPFPTLAEAQNASGPNDMIYVFPGNGTTQGMNTGIILQDGQTLFGSGRVQKISTTKGSLHIPAFSSTAPSLTNAGSIITLANGNEVAGMNLLVTQTGSNALDGTSGINGAYIHHNTIAGGADHTGIYLIGFGEFVVTNNHVTGPTVSVNRGIRLFVLDGQFATMNISDNIISGYQFSIIAGPQSNPTTSSADITISGNVISNFGRGGIYYPTGMANSIVRITNNTILNNTGTGGSTTGAIVASVNLAPDSGSIFINNNTIMTTTIQPNVNGILGEVNLPTGAFGRISIKNNIVQTGSGSGSSGIKLTTQPTDTWCATLTNNQVQLQAATGTNGLNIAAGTGTIFINNFSNSNLLPSPVITGNVQFVAPDACQ